MYSRNSFKYSEGVTFDESRRDILLLTFKKKFKGNMMYVMVEQHIPNMEIFIRSYGFARHSSLYIHELLHEL